MRFLMLGSTGAPVRELQAKLQADGGDPGAIDGWFGPKTRRAVLLFQTGKALRDDGLVGPVTAEHLGLKVAFDKPDLEREQAPLLLLANPNYFGNLPASSYQPVKVIKSNVDYEELVCIGYNPDVHLLGAIIHLKKESGYRTAICGAGSVEYVRFFVDWNNDGTWEDVGVATLDAHDVPGPKPLEYALQLPLQTGGHRVPCAGKKLPMVRGILSWDREPAPGEPDWPPIWGNRLDARIQVEPLLPLKKMAVRQFTETPFGMAQEIAIALDSVEAASPAGAEEAAPAASAEALHAQYKDTGVPPHRYLTPLLQRVAGGLYGGMDTIASLESMKQTLGPAIEQAVAVWGGSFSDNTYEELACVGYNREERSLQAGVRVKLPNGYSGELCDAGSLEHVLFWVRPPSDPLWHYVGMGSVRVHDIPGIPSDGLMFAVEAPCDLNRWRQPCEDGPVTLQVRAVLAWNELPSNPSNPDPSWEPRWGYRMQTRILLNSGPKVELDPNGNRIYEPQALIERIEWVRVCHIDPASGLATTGDLVVDSPFGGTVTVRGYIDNAPGGYIEGGEPPLRYRILVRKLGEPGWQPVATSFSLAVTDHELGHLPVAKTVTQVADADGFFVYQEDLYGTLRRRVTSGVLVNWPTNASMDGIWLVRMEIKLPDGTVQPSTHLSCRSSGTIRVKLDNTRPTAQLEIEQVYRDGAWQSTAACEEFIVGERLRGTYTVTDLHARKLTLMVEPAGGNPVSPPQRSYPLQLPTLGETGTWELNTAGMPACGYIVKLRVWDRTNVNHAHGNIGWYNADSRGFCLKEPKPGS